MYCYRCGYLLSGKSETRRFNAQDTGRVVPKRRWGTARFDAQTSVQLHVRGHEKPIVVFFNADNEITMGRTHEKVVVDVDLSNYGAVEHGVSRRHALLRRQNDTIVVVDLESANSTFLNGQRIIPNEPRILRDGDELRLGRLVVRVTFELVKVSDE
jgi:hypothetical protein